MSPIKVETIEGESPLTVPPPLPLNRSINQSTVKCEWSLAGACACEDGQCEDCQASEKEDDEKDNILTMKLASIWPLNSQEADETVFHPPIWEDCEEAKETDNASETENEDMNPVLETIDDNLGEGPVIEQVRNLVDGSPRSPRRGNTSENGENESNVHNQTAMFQQVNTARQRNNKVIANSEGSGNVSTEPHEEREKEATVLSSLSLRRSTRVQKGPVNYALMPEAEEEEVFQNTGTSDTEESDSDESETEAEMETDGDPSATAERSSIAANSGGNLSRQAFPCGYCGKAYARKYSARLHENTVHRQIARPRPYVCGLPDCGKAFEKKVTLEVHCLIHSGDKPFSCTTCCAAFNSKSNLTRHQRTHTTERPYVCADCLKGFKSKVDLLRHSPLHSALRPFTCTDCGVTFRLKLTLKRHRKVKIPCVSRYAPSESRPFSCTVAGCGKAYKTRKTLNGHIRTHSGAKKLKCSVCEGTFSCRGTLRRHRRTLHGI